MGLFTPKDNEEQPPPLGGGPLGLGDPDDRRLRKTEKDIIIAKMLREEATKRCNTTLNEMLNCAKLTGLMVAFKCRQESNRHNDCLISYMKDPDFINEITEKYLNARSYYRSTGKPLEEYDRFKQKKKSSGMGFC